MGRLQRDRVLATFLLLLSGGSIQGSHVDDVSRQNREMVEVTVSRTVAVTKNVDVPAHNVKPPGTNDSDGPRPNVPPGLDRPKPFLDALMPNDAGVAGPPTGELLPPVFPGGEGPPMIPGPVLPPMPPMPTGIDIDIEGPGHLGDRCPDAMKDENGNFPDFCYDVIDENGACLLDDIIAPKDQCIEIFGEDFYNDLVETQKNIEETRAKAAEDGVIPETTQTPDGREEAAEKEAEKNEAIEAEGRRSVDTETPTRRTAAAFRRAVMESITARRAKAVRRDGPSRLQDRLNYLGRDFKSLGMKKRDGPSMNLQVLDSLNYMEHPYVGPTLGYFQSLGKNKRDGPSFNVDALNSIGYLEHPYNGPTLGYFESLGKK